MPSHADTVRSVTSGVCENRKTYFAELQRRWFFEDTQPVSEVIRHRIHEFREARNLRQEDLAVAMTAVGCPLTDYTVSKIENGERRVTVNELFAFAYVLAVPFARLVSSRDGERPIRAGGVGLERHEVANWLVWGPKSSREAMSAQTYMGLTRQIWTMVQVLKDERDERRRGEHRSTLARLLTELWQASPVRPGVMERQALREEMGSPQSADESPTAIE